MAKAKAQGKMIANNKKAYHDYFILDTYEAGIALAGTEVKSLRMGKCSIKESFIRIEDGEVLSLIHISQIGFREPDFETNTRAANIRAIGSEFQRARETAPDGVIGFNIMVALKDYDEHVLSLIHIYWCKKQAMERKSI